MPRQFSGPGQVAHRSLVQRLQAVTLGVGRRQRGLAGTDGGPAALHQAGRRLAGRLGPQRGGAGLRALAGRHLAGQGHAGGGGLLAALGDGHGRAGLLQTRPVVARIQAGHHLAGGHGLIVADEHIHHPPRHLGTDRGDGGLDVRVVGADPPPGLLPRHHRPRRAGQGEQPQSDEQGPAGHAAFLAHR